MNKLTRDDLFSLEQYAEKRSEFRAQVMAHKANRRIALGENATLVFEDQLTIRYQIQEMLRVEKIFEASGIEEELGAYNPLIPDGSNWKGTLLIEYPDVEERRQALVRLRGVEHKLWVQVDGHERVFAIANEDMERSNDDKTAAVHFVRFEHSQAAKDSIAAGADIHLGIDHPELPYDIKLEGDARASLVSDLT